MATKVIKTAGQVAFEGLQGELKTPMPWDNCSIKAAWEAFAAKHNIQPLTEEVPDKPTDWQLWEQASAKCGNSPFQAFADTLAEFIRLLRERDGEPLLVTDTVVSGWLDAYSDSDTNESLAEVLTTRINQHRGVRPVPQVTAEMAKGAIAAYLNAKVGTSTNRADIAAAADYLNAELAKAAPVQTVTAMKVAAYATLNSHLHTFEDAEDMKTFTRMNHDFSQAGYVDGVEHHPRKDGGM